jgi:hypothetical protein
MKKLLVTIIALTSLTASASERGSCSELYKVLIDRKSAGQIVGNVAALTGGAGLFVISQGTGTIALTSLTIATTPFLLPSIALTFGGVAIYATSEIIHDGRLERSRNLIEGAYDPNRRFLKSLARVNEELLKLGAVEADQESYAAVIQEMNEDGTLCPVKKVRKNGRFVFKTYNIREIENLALNELTK